MSQNFVQLCLVVLCLGLVACGEDDPRPSTDAGRDAMQPDAHLDAHVAHDAGADADDDDGGHSTNNDGGDDDAGDTCTPERRDCEGVCDGPSIADCNGVCHGTDVVDCLNVCGGTAVLDCTNTCNGTATRDDCGVCNGNNAAKDCVGTCFGDVVVDCAGTCGGTATVDCANTCNGTAIEDCAGTCNGTAALDCDGICNGGNLGITHYRDVDRDGLGRINGALQSCVVPQGRVTNASDCNDNVYGCTTDCTRCRGHLRLPAGIKLTSNTPGISTLPNAGGVANLGDVDGDAIEDLFVRDRLYLMNGDGTVKSERVYGASDLGVSSLTESFGAAVAALGDLDGNGVPDVAVSEPDFISNRWAGGASAYVEDGRVWVLLLTPQGAVASAIANPYPIQAPGTCSSSAAGPHFGSALASADLDGNGTRELIATVATSCDGGVTYPREVSGRIEVITLTSGGAIASRTAITSSHLPFSAAETNTATVAIATDLDGNGVRDLTIGTAAFSRQSTWTVLLSSTFGVQSYRNFAEADLVGVAATGTGGDFGTSVAWLGDVDQDGHPEVATGFERLAPEGGLVLLSLDDSGAVVGYSPVAERFESLGIDLDSGDGFGVSIYPIGDIDDDGVRELAVRAAGDDDAGADSGALWLMGFEADCGPRQVGDCNGALRDNCELVLNTIDNCGACGRTCNGRPHSSAGTCRSSVCRLTCDAGWLDCDRISDNGCETDSSGAAYAHAVGVSCNGGVTELSCASGWDDCDGNVDNGCEVDLTSTAAHCGSCGNACPIALGRVPACSSSQCGSGNTCAPIFSDCDGNTGNGCESCATSCSQHTSAPPGRIPAPEVCAGNELCTATVFRWDTYASNIATCELVCPFGYANCDGNPGNGCERDISVESSCGNCYSVCPVWSYSQYCALNDAGNGFVCR